MASNSNRRIPVGLAPLSFQDIVCLLRDIDINVCPWPLSRTGERNRDESDEGSAEIDIAISRARIRRQRAGAAHARCPRERFVSERALSLSISLVPSLFLSFLPTSLSRAQTYPSCPRLIVKAPDFRCNQRACVQAFRHVQIGRETGIKFNRV